MYADDFFALVRRCAAPNALIHDHKTRVGPVDVISVLDYDYPRRRPRDLVARGKTHEDWYVSSFVCNMTTNEFPRWSFDGVWIEPEQEYDVEGIPIVRTLPGRWLLRPAIGYKDLLMLFLNEGLILPSWELNDLLQYDTRKTCLNDYRYMYIQQPADDGDSELSDSVGDSEHVPPGVFVTASLGQYLGTDVP